MGLRRLLLLLFWKKTLDRLTLPFSDLLRISSLAVYLLINAWINNKFWHDFVMKLLILWSIFYLFETFRDRNIIMTRSSLSKYPNAYFLPLVLLEIQLRTQGWVLTTRSHLEVERSTLCLGASEFVLEIRLLFSVVLINWYRWMIFHVQKRQQWCLF